MISEWVSEALKVSGMDQAKLAERLSIRLGRPYTRQMINKILKQGRKVTTAEMAAISMETRFAPYEGLDLVIAPLDSINHFTRMVNEATEIAFVDLILLRSALEASFRAIGTPPDGAKRLATELIEEARRRAAEQSPLGQHLPGPPRSDDR